MKKFNLILICVLGSLLLVLSNCKKDSKDDENKNTNSIKDYDGNEYNSVTIGNQVWLKENLRTTKLNDGTPITNKTDDNEWSDLTSPGYCWYNNDPLYYKDYGPLYNFLAASSGKLCPNGWHVPSADEWNTLFNACGGKGVAAAKLKEKGSSHWSSTNVNATDEFGFTALPAGIRSLGSYFSLHKQGFWWSTTKSKKSPVGIIIAADMDSVRTGEYFGDEGFSIKCLKD